MCGASVAIQYNFLKHHRNEKLNGKELGPILFAGTALRCDLTRTGQKQGLIPYPIDFVIHRWPET
jgi:hypothetical protein